MPRKKTAALVVAAELETRIHIIREQRVMLDFQLAELYGVSTMRLNEQVTRNLERFPPDFAFLLTPHEVTDLISQNAISKAGRGGRTKLPRAFTEQGIAMLSSVLRSPMAVRVNIEIMRAFVRLRRLLATPGDLVAQLQKLAQTVQFHDTQIKAIADVLRKMMEPPPETTPKRRIGFAVTDDQNIHEEKS